MRQQSLSAVKAGITRLRDKGGASPESLYDLLNGYVTAARTIKMRPGSRLQLAFPPGTKGLVYFQGKFVVFANESMPAGAGYEVEVLKHPGSDTAVIADIHFAMPFLGYLYVVAEFDNGDVFHFWLEKGEVWQPGKAYMPGALVRPSVANGLTYRLAGDRSGYVPWAPNVERATGAVVVPVVDNGFKYTVIETIGPSPRSGTNEPAWPTNPGGTVYEDANVQPQARPQTQAPIGTGPGTMPSDVADRYGNGMDSNFGEQVR